MELHSKFLDALTPSAIRAITAKIRDKAAAGETIISFAGGLPSADLFPVDDLRRITDAAFDEEAGNAIQYAASDGYDPFREFLAGFMERFGVTGLNKKNILITSGSQQALAYLSKGLLEEGSVVITENPSYPGALETFKTYGAQIVGIPMEEDGMDLEKLECALKQNPRVAFIYTIADYQNPMGVSLSIEKRKELIRLAEAYDTFIVEDAPYAMISFSGNVNPAVKSFDREGRVLYLGSTSKTIAPGLRIGWIVADEASIQKLVYLKMRDDLQVNNLAQRQVLHYMKDCGFDDHLRLVTEEYKRRKDTMVQAIRDSFPEGTKIFEPGGGLFLWLELPEHFDTMAMFDFVFQKNIAYVPGQFFCPDQSRKYAMRLNFSTTDVETIRTFIPLLGEMICSCPV